MAAASSIIISIGFKTLIYLKGDPHLGEAVQLAWVNFSTRSYPFVLMAFSTAALTGYLIDLRLPRHWPNALRRLANGAIQALGTAAAAGLVYFWLQSIRQPPPLIMLLRSASVIGFAIGFIVPCWYWRGTGRRDRTRWTLAEEEWPVTMTSASG